MDIAKLNDRMEIDHVVHVAADGTVTDALGVYAPELYVMVDTEGQIADGADLDMLRGAELRGWSLVSAVQPLYGQGVRFAAAGAPDAVQHTSTGIGWAHGEFMREHPGFWVRLSPSVVVDHDCTDDGEPCENCQETEERGLDGWILAYKAV